MRKIFLKLEDRRDIRIARRNTGSWVIHNKFGQSAVIRHGLLRRGIVKGCYIEDHSSMSANKLLTRDDYTIVKW